MELLAQIIVNCTGATVQALRSQIHSVCPFLVSLTQQLYCKPISREDKGYIRIFRF